MTLAANVPCRIAAVLAFLALLLFAPPAPAQQDWTGDWNGTLRMPGGELRLRVNLSRDAQGALIGELESLDQAPGQKIPLRDVAIANGRLSFSIPSIGAHYAGDWQPEPQVFAGTFTQGVALPLSFARDPGAAQPIGSGLGGT